MTPQDIFVRYFWPLYPPDLADDLAALERARTADANPARNPGFALHLEEAARHFTKNAPALFGEDLCLDGSDASVHRLGAALTRTRRDAWAAHGVPGTGGNLLFNAVVHGAAYVGTCVTKNHRGTWSVRRPLWESRVRLTSRAGDVELAVFHWWLKSLGDSGIGGAEDPSGAASLADRYRTHVEIPCADPSAAAVVFVRDRALPRLKEPTYDRLHKYLRAHLPELRDVGPDFPTAERFAAFAFRWVDFLVVGDGRSVVLAGASPSGLHLFWLGSSGFEKGAFFAGDAVPEPIVRVRDERITVMTSQRGEPQTHEFFWWGP